MFYVYDECTAHKGSNEVASFLFHFINTYLHDEVEELQVFCDSAGGQNKNFTIVRFIHFITSNQIHGLKNIKITFPIRGHSYLECDKNVGLWNMKEKMETPKDFVSMVEKSRNKPTPFKVVHVEKEMVLDWKSFFDTEYGIKCPFKTQPTKEISAATSQPRLISWRTTYKGPMYTSVIKKSKRNNSTELASGEFHLPPQSYSGRPTNFLNKCWYNSFKAKTQHRPILSLCQILS